MKIFLFINSIFFCAGVACGFFLPARVSLFIIGIACCAASLAGIYFLYKRGRFFWSDLCILCAFFFLGSVFSLKEAVTVTMLEKKIVQAPVPLRVRGIVDFRYYAFKEGFNLYNLSYPEIASSSGKIYALPMPVRVRRYSREDLIMGEEYEFLGRIKINSENTVPQALVFVKAENPPAVVPPDRLFFPALVKMQEQLRGAVKQYISPASYAFFSAFFFGRRELLTPALKQAFRNTGTYHILSISGLHIAAFYFFVFYLLKVLRVPYTVRLIVSLAIVGLYCIMAGNSIPTQRSFLMIAVFVATFFVQRKIHPLQSLGIVFFLLLALYPWSLFDVGFWLSFLSVFFIIAGFQIMSRAQWAPTLLETLFYTSIFATLATFPLTAKIFSTIPLLGIFINMLVVPLSSLIVFCGMIRMLSLLIPSISSYCFLTLDALIRGMIFIAAEAGKFSAFRADWSGIPFWLILAYYGSIVGFVMWKVNSK